MNRALQRDWRRRGYLEDHGGKHVRFSLHEVAKVLLLKSMSAEGFGPATSKGFAFAASESIVYYAVSATIPKIIGSNADRREYKRHFEESIDEIELLAGVSIDRVNRYIFRLGNGEIYMSNSAEESMSNAEGDYTILCRNLEIFSRNLIKAVKCPLATVFLGVKIEEYNNRASL